MHKKNRVAILAVFAPLLLGALASFLAQQFLNPPRLMVFKIDVGMAAFVTGAVLTLFLGTAYLSAWRKERSAQRAIERSLQEAEQGRQRFLRRLDHEIKNPLTGLRAALVNLQESQTSEERQLASEHASRAVERLTRLLNDLRKLSDLDKHSMEHAPVDMSELLDDVVETARAVPAHWGRNINLFITKVPSPLPPVTGDRDLLALAVYNLVENALKFTAANDPVEVRALEDGRSLVVEVADSGAGISPEELSKIFEELYRGSNARSTEGSGLGLALVQRIVTLHGGQIEVRSRQDGPHGTVFTVRLPESR